MPMKCSKESGGRDDKELYNIFVYYCKITRVFGGGTAIKRVSYRANELVYLSRFTAHLGSSMADCQALT